MEKSHSASAKPPPVEERPRATAILPSCEPACTTYCDTPVEEMEEKARPPDVL